MKDKLAASTPQPARDVELAEMQLQNAATWKVLDNATQLREMAVRLHGAAVGLAPFAIGLVDREVVLFTGSVGIAFLCAVSFVTFRNLDVLRLLQFRLAVEEGRARVRLRAGTTTYHAEKSYRPPILLRQRDPMGITTRSMLAVTAVDLVALGLVTGIALFNRSSDSVRIVATMSGGAVGALAAFCLWKVAVRQATARELDLSIELESQNGESDR